MNRRLFVWASLVVTAVAVLSVHAALFGGPQETSLGLQPKLGAEASLPVEGALPPAGNLAAEAQPSAASQIATVYGGLPLHFEPNQGQTDPRVAFLSRAPGYALFLTPDQVTLSLTAQSVAEDNDADPPDGDMEEKIRDADAESSDPTNDRGIARVALGMRLIGTNPDLVIEGLDELPGKSNYFIGSKENHVTGVPHFKRVAYREVYPGIDLILYGNQGQLEYDFVVGAGADPGQIELTLRGTEEVHIDDRGNLVVSVPGGELLQRAPVIYQGEAGERGEAGEARVPVGGRYRLEQQGVGDFRVRFEVEAYDNARALVIDPVLSYSTYFGGSVYDNLADLVVDSAGNAYVAGSTSSSDFPTEAAWQPTHLGGVSFSYSDAFVTKINPTGSAIVYSTFLGTLWNDNAVALAVDSSGSAYVTGTPGAASWPTAGTALPMNGVAMFLTKFNPAGDALVYSHILGGTTGDRVHDIAIDTSGNVYLTGKANSADLPTANAIRPTKCSSSDAFATKINPAGDAFLYSTYLGGCGDNDYGAGIVADVSGNAYITGTTNSSDFMTASPIQSALKGLIDAFVMKLSADGSTLAYSTLIGGFGLDNGVAIDINAAGNAFVTGDTSSSDFPTAGAAPGSWPGGQNAFMVALTPAGSSFVYSGYLGGSDHDGGAAISVDPGGLPHITGSTSSSDFPTLNAYQASRAGSNQDAFHTVVAADGSIAESTYIGGSGSEGAQGLDARHAGAVYIGGSTGSSSDFPTFNALQPTYGGGSNDFYLMKFCDWSIDPTSDTYTYEASGDIVAVTAGPGCPWTAVSNDSWITVTDSGPESGSYSVAYTVDANPTIIARQGTMTIAGGTVTIDQGGAPCTYGLSPTSANFSQSAGVDSVAVTTLTGCPWTAVSNDAWIHVTGGASGTDGGTVDYSVDQNTTASIRSGSMTIGGHSFPVDQEAGTAPADPSGLAVASSSSRHVGLSWVDDAGDETEYQVERKEGAAGIFALIQTLGPNTTSYSDPTVLGNTAYTYRVMACNLIGCSNPSNEVAVTTKSLTYFIGETEVNR